MKKIIAVTLSAVTACSSFAAFAADHGDGAENFSDVPSTHWAFDYIGEMTRREVISGYPDGRFMPENQVTRAEFAKIMVCAAGLQVPSTVQTSFTDVYTGDWYCPYIEAAKDYLTGYSTEAGMVYRPTSPAVREDIAAALVKLKGYDTSAADESILNMFSDSSSISDPAKKYVAVAVEQGLISGYDDSTFRGQSTITRAEAAAMLSRAFPNVTGSSESNANDPQTTNQPLSKPYKVDTLKSVDLKYPTLQSTYDYEGNKIYYLDGMDVYELDPYTGDSKSIYNAEDLTFQVEETQDEEEKEYSAYKPTQIIYDKYNDRLILNGYFSHLEQPFEEPSDKEKYKVAYDITNDEVCIDFYVEFESEGLNGNVALQCFIAKDKVLLNYSNPVLYNTEAKTRTHLGYESSMDENRYFWTTGNDLYVYGYEDHGSGFDGFSIFQYDFSSGFEYITHVDATQIGVNGQYVYYSSNIGVGSNSSVEINKLDLKTGSIEKLDITTDDDSCTVMDMQPIRLHNDVFIPVSDDHFVFYDTSADAFRVLTKN